MRKRRIVIGLVVCGMALMVIVVVSGLWHSLMSPPVRELSNHEIRPKFEMVAGNNLPESIKNVRGVFWQSRDPVIFVRFETDAEGISYMKRTFGGSSVKKESLDSARLRGLALSGWQPFWPLSTAEEELGTKLFDLESLNSALWLQQSGLVNSRPEYVILIDLENSIVYMKAMRI